MLKLSQIVRARQRAGMLWWWDIWSINWTSVFKMFTVLVHDNAFSYVFYLCVFTIDSQKMSLLSSISRSVFLQWCINNWKTILGMDCLQFWRLVTWKSLLTRKIFLNLGHMRKGLGRNRNWRGRMTREDMMQLLYLFKCKTVHCTTARMPLYKWITLEGNVNRSYIVLVTRHFL